MHSRCLSSALEAISSDSKRTNASPVGRPSPFLTKSTPSSPCITSHELLLLLLLQLLLVEVVLLLIPVLPMAPLLLPTTTSTETAAFELLLLSQLVLLLLLLLLLLWLLLEADVAAVPPSPTDDTLVVDEVTLEEPVTADVPFELLLQLPLDEPPVTALVVPLATLESLAVLAVEPVELGNEVPSFDAFE